MNTKKPARVPKQERSKASLERLLSAAEDLLAEKGYADFTLQELRKRSKVSVGSIYNLFSSKDELIHLITDRQLDSVGVEAVIVVNELRRKDLKLKKLVPELVKEYGEFFRRNKNTLRPLMEIADVDIVVAKKGKQFFAQNIGDFERLLLDCRDEISQPDPERAVRVGLRVVYASLARYLGFGTLDEVAGEGDWKELLSDLAEVMLYYLLGSPEMIRSCSKKAK